MIPYFSFQKFMTPQYIWKQPPSEENASPLTCSTCSSTASAITLRTLLCLHVYRRTCYQQVQMGTRWEYVAGYLNSNAQRSNLIGLHTTYLGLQGLEEGHVLIYTKTRYGEVTSATRRSRSSSAVQHFFSMSTCPFTVVWNDYLLIFFSKMSHFISQKSWKLVANNQIY